MEQLFSAGKAYLKINLLVKTPLHEFMAVERSGLWALGSVVYKWRCESLQYCRFLVVLPQLQRFGAAVGQFQLVWTRKDNFN